MHSLWVGSRGVYKALDEPCKAYFPHTFGLKTPEFFFRLNLIVVRLVSGFPGLVRVSPSLFHKLGSFADVRSATRVRLLGIGSAFCIRFGILETVRLHLFALFSDGLRYTAAVVVVVVFTTASRLVAPIESIYHTSLGSLCAGQAKLSSVRFNQTVIILKHKLVN